LLEETKTLKDILKYLHMTRRGETRKAHNFGGQTAWDTEKKIGV
jgi:hypothetical protein